MISDNKRRYEILEKELSGKFILREIPQLCSPSYDTFILFEENNRKKEIIKILTNQKFGTKFTRRNGMALFLLLGPCFTRK